MAHSLPEIVKNQFRFLAFRKINLDLEENKTRYIGYIFFVSWLAGMGRYWDHPDAYTWQYLGLGSVSYVAILSAFLYLTLRPLRPQNWSYDQVCIFVGLTSLPALLYATPVERFMDLRSAQIANAWFLGIVATWRVALYVNFLVKAAKLTLFQVVVGTVLPISAIIVALSLLNLEHVVFDLMAGIRDEDRSQNDNAYIIVFSLSIFAFISFPVTLICYFWMIRTRRIEIAQGK